MIAPIPLSNKTADLSCCVIKLNDFKKRTNEVDLITRRARYERTLPGEGKELIFPRKNEVLK